MFLANHEIFQSFCRTLAHSLWQGLALALLAGMVMLMTRKTSAGLRYNLLAFLGLAFICGVGLTFYLETQTNQPATYQTTYPESSRVVSPVLVTYNNQDLQQQQQPQTVIDSVAGFLDQYALWIVSIWFAVFVFKCIQLVKGLRQIHYLRYHQVFAVNDDWNKRLQQLQSLLNMKTNTRLFESALVKTPVMIGFFKPMILVPVGLLANMPVAEAEAILLHELAHIRRRDYLVNLVQGIGEVVFFFNPGFLWVSSLLKTERENCCDDLAIAATQNKQDLVKALVYSQEFQLNQHQLALGFGRKKTPLLDRVKRILYNHNQSLNTMEKTFLSVCIVLGLCVALAFKSQSTTNQVQFQHDPYEVGVTTGESMSEEEYMEMDAAMAETNERIENDIPEDADAPEAIEPADIPEMEDAPSPPTPPTPPSPPSPPAPIAPLSPIALALPPAFAPNPLHGINILVDDSLKKKAFEDANKKMAIEIKKLTEDMRQMEIVMAQANKDMSKADKEQAKAQLELKRAEIEMAKANIELAKAELERAKAEKLMQKAREQADLFKKINTALIQDLQKPAGKKINSYRLDKQELIVNGKKQSAEWQQQLSKKYLKEKITVLCYHYTSGKGKEKTTMTGIKIED